MCVLSVARRFVILIPIQKDNLTSLARLAVLSVLSSALLAYFFEWVLFFRFGSRLIAIFDVTKRPHQAGVRVGGSLQQVGDTGFFFF